MSKQLIIESLSTPDQPGYLDKLLILDNDNPGFHCQCSACPNPYQPQTKQKWQDVYGWIACNTKDTAYTWECKITPKHGKCLVLNDGGHVPTRFLDKRNNAMYAKDVLIHRGDSDIWRGSMACITLPPIIWLTFIQRFTLNEKGLLFISDYSGNVIPPAIV